MSGRRAFSSRHFPSGLGENWKETRVNGFPPNSKRHAAQIPKSLLSKEHSYWLLPRKTNFRHNTVVCTSYISKPSEAVQPSLGSDSDLISATGHVCYTKIGDLKIVSNKIALFLEVLQSTHVILLRELC